VRINRELLVAVSTRAPTCFTFKKFADSEFCLKHVMLFGIFQYQELITFMTS
jgi:hypothetical protein